MNKSTRSRAPNASIATIPTTRSAPPTNLIQMIQIQVDHRKALQAENQV
jgi:hypothetical protein